MTIWKFLDIILSHHLLDHKPSLRKSPRRPKISSFPETQEQKKVKQPYHLIRSWRIEPAVWGRARARAGKEALK
jgi:hypothetical protein